MSYEYFAPLPQGGVRVSSELLRALTRRLPLALVAMSEDKLSLRWLDLPPRLEWPEDIDVYEDCNGILISIHTATAEQRRTLLNALAEELAKISGMPVEFEER